MTGETRRAALTLHSRPSVGSLLSSVIESCRLSKVRRSLLILASLRF